MQELQSKVALNEDCVEVADSDLELVVRLLANEPGADEAFVGRFSRLIYTILWRSGLPSQDLEDVYQKVFVHLWEHDFHRLRQWNGMSKLSAFLTVVVRHLAADYQRYRRHTVDYVSTSLSEPEGKISSSSESCDTALIRQEQRSAMFQAMQKISMRDYDIIVRRHCIGHSYKEIAEALGITTDTVGMRLSRAKRRLQAILQAEYGDMFASD